MYARRGRKPKPSGKRELEGNREHRPILPDPLAEGSRDINNLDPPVQLKGRHKELWDQHIRRVPWITWADIHLGLMWVKLAYQLETENKLSANLMKEFRAATASLGLDPSARASRLEAMPEAQKSKINSLIGKAA